LSRPLFRFPIIVRGTSARHQLFTTADAVPDAIPAPVQAVFFGLYQLNMHADLWFAKKMHYQL